MDVRNRLFLTVVSLLALVVVAICIGYLQSPGAPPVGAEDDGPSTAPTPRARLDRLPERPPRTTLPEYWSGVWGHGRTHETWEMQLRITLTDGDSVLVLTRYPLPHGPTAEPPLLYVLRGRWHAPEATDRRWTPSGEGQLHWLGENRIEHMRPLRAISGSVHFRGDFLDAGAVNLIVEGEVFAFTVVGIGDRQGGLASRGASQVPAITSEIDPPTEVEVQALFAEAAKNPGKPATGWMPKARLVISVSEQPDHWVIAFSTQPGSTAEEVEYASTVIKLWLGVAFPGRSFQPSDFRALDMSDGVILQVPRE